MQSILYWIQMTCNNLLHELTECVSEHSCPARSGESCAPSRLCGGDVLKTAVGVQDVDIGAITQ